MLLAARPLRPTKTVTLARAVHTYTRKGIFPRYSVSTTHAEVTLRRGQGLFVEDRGSTNGTYIDGTELEPMVPVPLVDGQEISFGSDTKVKVDICTIDA